MKKVQMTDDELMALIAYERDAVLTNTWSLLERQRINANYQYAHVLDKTFAGTAGFSNVVMNYTNPAVDTLTTYMSNIFCRNKETVSFSSVQDELYEMAQQVTDMVNAVIFKKNDGYKLLSQVFRDAAINKNSIIKISWQEETKAFEEEVTDVTPEQLTLIIAQKEEEGYTCEVTDRSKEKITQTLAVLNPLTGEMEETVEETELISAIIRCGYTEGRPVIDSIPPEEFLINEGAVAINGDHKTKFVAHRRLVFATDIKEMFPEIDVEDLPDASQLQFDVETLARHYSDGTYNYWITENGQPATRVKELTESWVLADRDGDGIAEWRHCFSCGNELLYDEEWFGDIPFASFTYFPIPHKFFGQSVFDKLVDYERSATALLRSEVDSAVMRNTTRIIVNPRVVNPRDVQQVRHGIIRANPGFTSQDIYQLQTNTGGGGGTELLELIRGQVIAEIGIDPVSGQISTDVEKSGNDAAKTAMVMDNASAKIESYAREFAEACLRDVIWQLVVLLVNNADAPFVQQLVKEVSGDMPFLLAETGMYNALNKSDLTAKVGLGHMTGQQKIASSQTLIQTLSAFAADPAAPFAIPAKAKWKMLKEMAEGFGHENPDEILGTEEEAMAESEQVKQVQMQQATAQQQGVMVQQGQLELQQQSQQQQFALQQQEFELRKQIDMMKAEAQILATQARAEKTVAETEKLDLEMDIAEALPPVETKFSL